MIHTFDAFNYTLRFEKGEKLIETLLAFIKAKQIKGGWISGLGGLTWAELGFYNLPEQTYEWRKFEELLELGSLTGNIAWQDDEPTLHLHAVIGDKDLHAYTGHLKEAEVAGTVEVRIHRWNQPEGFTRSHDKQTGLNLLDL